eukprot:Em0002g1912a
MGMKNCFNQFPTPLYTVIYKRICQQGVKQVRKECHNGMGSRICQQGIKQVRKECHNGMGSRICQQCVKQAPDGQVARWLEVLSEFDYTVMHRADQGKNFQAKILKEICTLLDIKKTRTTAYHPQSDGLVERFNRTLLSMLSMVVQLKIPHTVDGGYSKKFHKPWQGPFKVVEVLGPSVYRIADCANPKKQKVVHFNRLKPGPEEAEAPPPEITLGPTTPGQPTDPLDALPNGVGEQNVIKIPILTLQLVITKKIFYLPLYQWSLRIDNLSLGQLQMFQGQDSQPESEGLPCTTVIQLKFLRPYKNKN